MDISMEVEYTDTNTSIDEALKTYIKNKINDTKIQSKIVENNLKDVEKQEKQCVDLIKSSEKFNTLDLKVVGCWQRIHNTKWILGVDVANLTKRPATNINVILKWNCKQELVYSVKIYSKYISKVSEEEKSLRNTQNLDLNSLLDSLNQDTVQTPVENELIQSHEIQINSTVVILIDIPEFIKCKDVTLEGILTYEKNIQKYQKTLPNFTLNVTDIISDKFTLKLGNVVKGTNEDFLSVLSTSKFTPVNLVLPEGIYRTLEGILQIDCFFTKVEIPSRGLIVVFDGTSERLKYACLKLIIGTNNVTLITQNDEQLFMLYHHLYTSIPGVIILDKNSEQINESFMFTRPTQSFMEPLTANQEHLKEFALALDNQLIYIENSIKQCTLDNKVTSKKIDVSKADGDYSDFRMKLTSLEYESDKLFLKVFEKKNE